MFARIWLILLVVTPLCGCANRHKPTRNRAETLPITGAWSEEVAGIRSRMRVASTHVNEVGTVLAALEVLNASDRRIDLRRSGQTLEPETLWSLGPTIYFGSQLGAIEYGTVRSGSSTILGPVRLPVTPAVRPRLGAQSLSASVAVGDARVSAPPLDIWIAPAEWGMAVDGVRLCVGAEQDPAITGEPVRLLLYVHNFKHDPLTFAVPDWSSPQVRSEDGVVTLAYTSNPGGKTMDHQRGLIQRHVLDVSKIFLQPGVYRIRVELKGVPPGSSLAPLASNEIVLRINRAAK